MERTLVDTEFSDEWWFHRLFEAFYARKKRRDGKYRTRVQWADYLWKWYEGNPELPQHTEGWQSQVTKDVLRMGRANLAMLAVESKLDRIQLLGFHPTDTTDDDDAQTGPEATSRELIAKYGTVFDDSLLYASVMGDGYIWCGGVNPRDGLATVTAEDPRSCVTIDDPLDPTTATAALKMYRNDVQKLEYAHVVMPAKEAQYGDIIDASTGERELLAPALGARIRVATRPSRGTNVSSSWSAGGWEWKDDASGEFPPDVQGRGTFVHHVQAPSGIGDIEPVLDNLERINNMIVDRLWISKFQAFRQRAMQEKDGGDAADRPDPMPENDPETGLPIDWDSILSADPGAVWRLPIGMTIWESTPTDLQGALLSVRDDIKEFAATTRTPIYVFTPDAVSGSATGASLAREGQVFKAEKWMKRHSPVFIRACADMLAVSGFPSIADAKIELKWGPAERITMTERAAAGAAAKLAGVPQEGIWEDYMQASPEQMIRYRALAKVEQAKALLLGTPPAPSPTRPADVPVEQPPTPSAPDPLTDGTFGNRVPA